MSPAKTVSTVTETKKKTCFVLIIFEVWIVTFNKAIFWSHYKRLRDLGPNQTNGRSQIAYVERKNSNKITKVMFALISKTISVGLIK